MNGHAVDRRSERLGPSDIGGEGVLSRVQRIPVMDLVPFLTLVLLIQPGGGRLQFLVASAAALALVWRKVQVVCWFWFGLVGLRLASHLLTGWHVPDNHQYLLTYWCLALGLVLTVPSGEREGALRINARLLVGLCFALAVVWKLQAGEYLDGSFFQYNLLTVERFHAFASFMGIDADVIRTNNRALLSLARFPYVADAVVLQGGDEVPRVYFVALSIWTIAVELVIAAAFLLPLRGFLGHAAHVSLLTFLGTTYLMAPVVTFALLLSVLGVASLRSEDHPWRMVYLVAFMILPPVLATIGRLPALGFLASGSVLLVGYAYWRERVLLIAGAMTLGLSMGLIAEASIRNATLGVGTAVVALSVFDRMFARATASWIQATGAALLVITAVLASDAQSLPFLLALFGLGALGLMTAVPRRASS